MFLAILLGQFAHRKFCQLCLGLCLKNYVCVRGLLGPDQLNVFWTYREHNTNFSLIHKVPNHVLLGFLPFEEELLNKIILNCSFLGSLRIGKIWCYGWEILHKSVLFFYTSICQIGIPWEGSLTHLIQCAASQRNINSGILQFSCAGEASRSCRSCCINTSMIRPFAPPQHCGCFLGSRHFTPGLLQRPPLLHRQIQCYPQHLCSEVCHKVRFLASLF